MRTDEPKAIRLADYRPPAYQTRETHLRFELGDDSTIVTNTMRVERQPHAEDDTLALDGEHLELVSLSLNGKPLGTHEFEKTRGGLRVYAVGERAELEIVTRIFPAQNTALEGLYISSGMYCTQCEAQGFRRITYFQDRPDVSARYTTTIVADGSRYPVMLSNGNLIADEALADGRRSVTWEDPFPKPSYLFALVAGDLEKLEDSFMTMSGREVKLQIFSEAHNIGDCGYAMDALKRSMRWDEVTYGREYDLDIFMIVAVDDFNMGAMENKGLNIFNTSCVLASADTATDARYRRVEGVVAHEYFHNWSGNRVTCRDWFQLSLKEGFTVFRDAEFSADMNSRRVKRIEDVRDLRAEQFPEDAGPLAHAVRPDSYVEISNFYTRTVYEKGAEVVRMLLTLLGEERFRKGSDLYFERHDGSAATTDDFLQAMKDVSEIDLDQFQRWYEQAGTPVLHVEQRFESGKLSLDIRQHCPPTPGQANKAPFLIPVLIGLVDDRGEALDGALGVESDAEFERRGSSLLLRLRHEQTRLVISGLKTKPAVSFLRGFSAPVRVEFERPDSELDMLIRHDVDGFCRWDAARERSLAQMVAVLNGGAPSDDFIATYRELIGQATAETDAEAKLLAAQVLTLPSEVEFFAQLDEVDVDRACTARDQVRSKLASEHLSLWQALYEANAPTSAYAPDREGGARRALREVALAFIGHAEPSDALSARVEKHYRDADNLTDRLMALRCATDQDIDGGLRESLLEDFFARWKGQALVVDEWFSLQASSSRTDAQKLAELEAHEAFNIRNPNKVRALYRDFATQNHRRFHAADGSGYALIAERVARLDSINPQLAARLARAFAGFRKFDPQRQRLVRAELEKLSTQPNLSKDVFEVVSKSLRDGEDAN